MLVQTLSIFPMPGRPKKKPHDGPFCAMSRDNIMASQWAQVLDFFLSCLVSYLAVAKFPMY
jgi:hypothetical protein